MKMIRIIKARLSESDYKLALENPSWACHFIITQEITPNDIRYKDVLKAAVKYGGNPILQLIDHSIISKNDPLVHKSIEDAIKNSDYSGLLFFLYHNIVDSNSPYYTKILDQIIEQGIAQDIYRLLKEKWISTDDSRFNKALRFLIDYKGFCWALVKNNIIPKNNPYYNKAVEIAKTFNDSDPEEEEVDLSPSNFSNYLSECEPEELELACRALRLTPKQITGEDTDWDGVYVEDMIEALHNKATTDKLKVKVMKVIEEDRQ